MKTESISDDTLSLTLEVVEYCFKLLSYQPSEYDFYSDLKGVSTSYNFNRKFILRLLSTYFESDEEEEEEKSKVTSLNKNPIMI